MSNVELFPNNFNIDDVFTTVTKNVQKSVNTQCILFVINVYLLPFFF